MKWILQNEAPLVVNYSYPDQRHNGLPFEHNKLITFQNDKPDWTVICSHLMQLLQSYKQQIAIIQLFPNCLTSLFILKEHSQVSYLSILVFIVLTHGATESISIFMKHQNEYLKNSMYLLMLQQKVEAVYSW